MEDTERIELIVKLLVKPPMIQAAVDHFAKDEVITDQEQEFMKESGYNSQHDLIKILKKKVCDTNKEKEENLEKIIDYFKDLLYPKKIPLEEKIKSLVNDFDLERSLPYLQSQSNGQEGKGYALFIYNQTFANNSYRTGAQHDLENMKCVLETKLGFTFKSLTNKNEIELLKGIKDCIKELSAGKYDSLIVVVSSHGDADHIETRDSKLVCCWKDIVKKFNLECLEGKPKIFLFNCCRGKEKNKENDKQERDESKEGEREPVMKQLQNIAPVPEVSKISQSMSDVLVCFSTVDDTPSFRSDAEGSYFLSYIHDCFNSQTMPIRELLRLASEKFKANGGKTDQMCTYYSIGFSKEFYLESKKGCTFSEEHGKHINKGDIF